MKIIAGTIGAGSREQAVFEFYRGTVGVRPLPDGTLEVAFAGDRPPSRAVDAEGSVGGVEVRVLSAAKSAKLAGFVVLIVEAVLA